MQLTTLSFVIDQWTALPAVERADLTGKTVVVVGANTGIGFEAAKHFARMTPAKLIVACRTESRGIAAVADIASATGFKSCELWQLDLADFASVIKFAEQFKRECDRLDILVMNAAVALSEFQETGDGWETSLQVNHLCTSLLSLLLLPHLVDTGRKFGSTSRLVIVASAIHCRIVDPEPLQTSKHPIAILNSHREALSMRSRYTETKLLNVFFARALQDRLQFVSPLSVNAVCPGFCYSDLRRNYRGLFKTIGNFFMEICLARTSEQGSRQLVYAAIGERNNEDRMKGAYVSTSKVSEPSDFVISDEGKRMQNNVWMETIDILTKEAPQLRTIVQEYLI